MIYVYRADTLRACPPDQGLRRGGIYASSPLTIGLLLLPMIGPNVHLLVIDRAASDPITGALYWIRNVWVDRTRWTLSDKIVLLGALRAASPPSDETQSPPGSWTRWDAIEALRDAAEVRPGVWLAHRDREHILLDPGSCPF